MKKNIGFLLILFLLNGCFGEIKNKDIINDLNKKLEIRNNQLTNIEMQEIENVNLEENETLENIIFGENRVYFKKGIDINLSNELLVDICFSKNEDWKTIIPGDFIRPLGIGGPTFFYAVSKNKNYEIYIEGFKQDYIYKPCRMLKAGEYKLEGNKISYLSFLTLESEVRKKGIVGSAVVGAGIRVIMYQVDMDFDKMKVETKMLAYKTWRRDDKKLIEEKYFY